MLLRDLAFEESGMKNARTVIEPQRFKWYDIGNTVKGFMLESYLEDGCQAIGENVYGKSITDPCLGWNKTEKLIYEMAELI